MRENIGAHTHCMLTLEQHHKRMCMSKHESAQMMDMGKKKERMRKRKMQENHKVWSDKTK
jgi:diphthamide biosynthesis methyltransferase